jgi:hypothetical protein
MGLKEIIGKNITERTSVDERSKKYPKSEITYSTN